eukprot:gnl/Spiro4/28131_TR13924_c0_g1_i1.p1 gnl/Spiro4/28131_TR13924_c0_g1~~gnl/Spiro4/28131_TR13924_c0_g1_i1.p1  ORF type:complete len:192 (+),score=36.09 gnl/Spiro4/28131_TR13924_c0_g1_i1:115-690(+)
MMSDDDDGFSQSPFVNAIVSLIAKYRIGETRLFPHRTMRATTVSCVFLALACWVLALHLHTIAALAAGTAYCIALSCVDSTVGSLYAVFFSLSLGVLLALEAILFEILGYDFSSPFFALVVATLLFSGAFYFTRPFELFSLRLFPKCTLMEWCAIVLFLRPLCCLWHFLYEYGYPPVGYDAVLKKMQKSRL